MEKKELKILIVDDDEDDYLLTTDLLKEIAFWEIDTEWCSSYEQALKHLKSSQYDLFFFDYLLGQNTGLDLLNKAKELNSGGPFILMTGKGDEKIAIDALRQGAADYVVKGEIALDNLARSIRYALERAQVINALKRSERQYKRIFEESRDILFISTLEGEIITINNSFRRVCGYSEDQILSMNVRDIILDDIEEVWADVTQNDTVLKEFEVRFSTKQGERRVALFTARKETFSDGKADVHCRLHDVTLRRQSERERLFSEKLAVTGRLVRMLAHEVRNPLTNVSLSAEQLEMELEDEDHKFYTDIIKRNCTRINDLITQLLQSSRPSDIVLIPSSLHSTLDRAIATAKDRLALKNISIVKEYYAEDLIVGQDTDTLQIAFLNLFLNAIEAMEEGKGILTISTRFTPSGIQVKVIDNGSGISEEKMQHIFEPYFTGKKSGMGIGLASTLNIVQAHLGRIDLESEEGNGTVFTLTFPEAIAIDADPI